METSHEIASIRGLHKSLWLQAKGLFEKRLGKSVAKNWLSNLTPLAFRRGTVWIGAANSVVRDYVDHAYRSDFEAIYREITGSPVTVQFEVVDYLKKPFGELEGSKSSGDKNPKKFSRRERAPRDGVGLQVPSAPSTARESRTPNFVSRSENKTAYAALKRSLSEPFPLYNPILIYGPTGSGKSALIRWYLQRLTVECPGIRAAVQDGESFTRKITRALRGGQISSVRGELASKELLIMEEVHRLAERPATQKQLLDLLKHYIDRNRQVILLSRHHPADIFELDPGLRSYMLSGMVLQLNEPSVPSRVAILQELTSRFRRPIAQDAIEFVAGNVPGGLKEELSLLKRAAALSALRHEPVSPALLKEHFPELGARSLPDEVLMRTLVLVCEEMKVDREQVLSGSKVRRVAMARHLTIFLGATFLGFSARRIGRSLGTVSPSVVPYAKKRVKELMKQDPSIEQVLQRVQSRIDLGQQYLFSHESGETEALDG